MVNLGLDNSYTVARMKKLSFSPALTGAAYRWTVDGQAVATTRDYTFLQAVPGEYAVSFDIIDDETPYHYDFTVTVVHESVEYSANISDVYEYCPAPGQFVNTMPLYEEGDNAETMRQKVEESIMGTNDVMVSLGGFGGYVTFGFDHTVMNIPGEKDFRIWGNAFYDQTVKERLGGSAEPGIVMVSFDENGNGLPDDTWYELAGSEYYKPETRHDYAITYFRPDADAQATPSADDLFNDIYHVKWTDSELNSGYISQNIFHTQSYFPQWIKDSEITRRGSRLADNGELIGPSNYVLYCYDWGYVDVHPNSEAELNEFDIDWAVDADGQHVSLPGVDFVRVYTGVNQQCGWLGETSTEICRAQDLHIETQ
jgi:hypothetical protein